MSTASGRDEQVFREKLRTLRRWGRWGEDDQRGALNLVDQSKVLQAVGLVRSGRVLSLSRPLAWSAGPDNPEPAQFYVRRRSRGEHSEGSLVDYVGVACHGKATTHIDALCHVWNHDGMWNGRDPDEEITHAGSRWAGVEHLAGGIITRGVLIDVAAHRPRGYVDYEEPVTGDELARVARADGVELRAGDALVIHSGREEWDRTHGSPWGSPAPDGTHTLPGLHHSCLDFFFEADCALVVWDMMDSHPNDFGVPHTTHAAIFSQGIPLLDNAVLEALATTCRELGKHEFLLCVAPLRIEGGTGSMVNPLAVF